MLFVDSHNIVIGVLTFFLFFFSFFSNSCLLIQGCCFVSEQGKKPDIPTVMSMLVPYLSKLLAKIISVIPEEGVSVDSHAHNHTHTLSMELRVRGLAENLCRPWRQHKCDNESVVKHMLGVMFRHFRYLSVCYLYLSVSQTWYTHPYTLITQDSWRADWPVLGMTMYNSLVLVCGFTPAVKKTDG